MDQPEFSIPEVQERQASKQLSDLYLNSSEGDRARNIRAISDALTVKYLEAIASDNGSDTFLKSDSKREAESTRRRYSGLPKMLVEGFEHEGQQIKPKELWLLAQTLKMKTFESAIGILDQVPDADTLYLIVDIVKKIDNIKSFASDSAKEATQLAVDSTEPRLTDKEYQDIVQEIEGLMSQKKVDMEAGDKSKNLEEIRRKKDIDLDVYYMTARCIDHAISSYPAEILKRLKTHIKSPFGNEILDSLIKEFSSLGDDTMRSIFHDENPEFMDDVLNTLKQSKSLNLEGLFRLKHYVEVNFKQ